MECEFCKNTFSTKTSLNSHQKTAKYCLKLRDIKVEKINKCDGCGKIFSRSYHLQRHQKKCRSNDKIYELESKISQLEKNVEKYKQCLSEKELTLIEKNIIIQTLREQIQQLQDKLENIALQAVKRPTTTNKTQINNFIQNMQPITQEQLIEHTPQLTLEHVQKGASGYAEYALEYPLKDRIACVDFSRRKIKFKNKDGILVSDPEMCRLTPMFFESIKAKSSELVFSQNNPDMDSAMFERVAKLFNTNSDVKNGADGVKSDFYHDFIKHVCSGSVVE
jgi:hypothetical protein